MEDEEGDAAPAAEAEGSPEMCKWPDWEDDCEEEDETPHPVPTPSTSKGSGKKGRGGRVLFELASTGWQASVCKKLPDLTADNRFHICVTLTHARSMVSCFCVQRTTA